MTVELYRPSQREEAESGLGDLGRRALGGALWDWRFRGDGPCFALHRRPGGPPAWMCAVRTEVVVSGDKIPAAQVTGGDLARLSGDEAVDRIITERLFEALSAEGVKLVYGAVDAKDRAHYESLGFFAVTEVAVRSLYLGLGISRRMGRERSFSPLRRIAQEAARIRTKLVEVPLDEEHLRRFSQAHALRHREYSFAINKSAEYLAWRYLQDPRRDYRFLTHRRKTGMGLDGFVVMRREASDRGRVEAQVVDHWTREPSRRAHAVFLGEVVLWAMTDQSEVLRALTVAGSNVEQALVGMGGVRKKVERQLMLKRIADDGPTPESLDRRKVALRTADLDLESVLAPSNRLNSR